MDFKEGLTLSVVVMLVSAIAVAIILGGVYLGERIRLDMTIKKIEILQEKELINNETMQVLIQDLKL